MPPGSVVLGHLMCREHNVPVDPQGFFASTRIIMGTGTVSAVRNREQQLGRKVTENDLEPIIWQRLPGFTGVYRGAN